MHSRNSVLDNLKPYYQSYLIILICSIICYISVVFFKFFYIDDGINIINNKYLALNFWQGIAEIWQTSKTPIPTTIWIAIKAIFFSAKGEQLSPFPFYVINIVLHSFNGILVFHFIKHLLTIITKQKSDASSTIYAALIGAIIFLIHPMQVQTVSWISELRTILSTAFILSSFFMYEIIFDKEGNIRLGSYIAYFILYTLALLTKPISVSFTLFLILYSSLIKKDRFQEILIKNIPVVLFSILAMFIYINDELSTNPQVSHLSQRILTFVYTNIFYLKKILFPINLHFVYEQNRATIGTFLAQHKILLAAQVLLVLLGSMILLSKKRFQPIVYLLAGWVFILLPTSGLVDFNYQMTTLVADRYVYLSLVMFSCILSFIFLLLVEHISKRWVKVVFSLFTIFLLGVTFRTLYIRHNEKILLKDAASKNPVYVEVYLNYLLSRKNLEEAQELILEDRDFKVISSSFLTIVRNQKRTIETLNLEYFFNRILDDTKKRIIFDPPLFNYLLDTNLFDASKYVEDNAILLEDKKRENVDLLLKERAVRLKQRAYIDLGDASYVEGDKKQAINFYFMALKNKAPIENHRRIRFIQTYLKKNVDQFKNSKSD